MLDNFPYKKHINKTEYLNRIVPHPTLPKEYYKSNKINYKLDSKKVNFAYFGAFYKTRRLDDLVESLRSYKINRYKYNNLKQPIVHIFTEQTESAKNMVKQEGLEEYFTINEYVNYFEFLVVSKAIDVLIVNDAKAKNVFGYNPYLPSKLSDYLGSKSKIWFFCEQGSAMDKLEKVDSYKSYIGQDSSKELLEILLDFSKRM